MLYRYVKKQPRFNVFSPKLGSSRKRYFAGFLLVVGIFLFINAAYPIISYQLLVAPRFSASFVSPSSEAAISHSFGPPQKNEFLSSAQVIGTEIDLVDYTKAGNWFSEEKIEKEFSVETDNSTYFLSIPKLGIEKAEVRVGVEDLKQSLIQYPGTAAPGRYGNTVVFGHSVLPQFFNPKNYLTIFSTLPTLKVQDEIIVYHNEVTYRYVIENMIEVSPSDISILAQRFDDSYLTLITCVPPGTYLRRLIIRARLAKI
ncbi:sortase [Candidatus Microgenomates bacterium]|jgi:sortase A|nr:MAG: sortase [Candidatus Microgenomates bacterium]